MFIDRIVNKLSLYVHRLSQIYSAWCICTCQTTLQGGKSRQKRKVQQFLSLQLPVLTGTNRVSDTFITCVWRRKTVGQPKHLSFVHLGAIYKTSASYLDIRDFEKCSHSVKDFISHMFKVNYTTRN